MVTTETLENTLRTNNKNHTILGLLGSEEEINGTQNG